MIKSFVKDALIYTLPTVLSRGIAIFLLPIYTRIASPEELGALDLFLVFGNIIAFTVALEISQGVARFIPELSDIKQRLSYSSTGLYFTLFMYALFFITASTFYVELNHFITGKSEYAPFFQLALVFIALHGFFYYFQNQLRFEGNSVGYAIVSVFYAAANLASAFVFGIVYDLGLTAILYSMIVSVLLASLLGLFLLRQSFGLVFKPGLLKQLLKFSIPLVPASMLVFVSLYVDRYMINMLIDLESVGQYGVAVRLASAASLVMIGFQMAITPLIYKHYNEHDTPQSLSVIFKYFVVFAVFFFLAYSLVAEELLILLTTPEFYIVANVIPLLVLALLFSNMYVFMPGIGIRKKTHLIFLISIVAAVINIVLNYALIPVFGIQGAALATTIGYFIAFLFFIFFSQKLYYVPHKWLGYLVLFVIASSFVYLYFGYFAELNYFLTLVVRLLLVLTLIALMFKLKLITALELLTIKNAVMKKVYR
ncbi:oligosaccharide flippase family protein [Alishewanella sp. d11]|uniref:oligosaccharide flippase family protein n=1 Tax=Alishewanella sp. d11 TaxID=3414030 RepID=UPI003BF7CB26